MKARRLLACFVAALSRKTGTRTDSAAAHHDAYLGEEIPAHRTGLLSAAHLRDFAVLRGARSGSDLLEALRSLKEEGIELKAVLTAHSDGLRPTSPDFPRVFLFHPRINSVVALNVNPVDGSCDEFEILEMEPRLRTQRLRFVGGNAKIDLPTIACTVCHGVDRFEAKPLFDSYLRWPNSYLASVDYTDEAFYSFSGLQYETDELKQLKRFLENRPGCYRHLDLSLYERIVHLITKAAANRSDSEWLSQVHAANDANFQLNSHLGHANFQRIARQIAAFDPKRRTLTAVRCAVERGGSDVESFVPERLLAHDGKDFAMARAEADAAAAREANHKRQRALANVFGSDQGAADRFASAVNDDYTVQGSNMIGSAALRFVFETLGHHIDNWTMQAHSYSLVDGQRGPRSLLPFLPELGGDDWCDTSAEKSRTALADWPVPSGRHERPLRLESAFGEVPVAFRCLSCHGSYPMVDSLGDRQPGHLPFDDAAEFRKRLDANPDLR
jgi:hypothetical protein